MAPNGAYTLSLTVTCGTVVSPAATAKVTVSLAAPYPEAAVTQGIVALFWEADACANSYEVYRPSLPDSGFTRLATVTEPQYFDQTVSSGATYYYRVRAVNSFTYTYGVGPVTGPMSIAKPVPAK